MGCFWKYFPPKMNGNEWTFHYVGVFLSLRGGGVVKGPVRKENGESPYSIKVTAARHNSRRTDLELNCGVGVAVVPVPCLTSLRFSEQTAKRKRGQIRNKLVLKKGKRAPKTHQWCTRTDDQEPPTSDEELHVERLSFERQRVLRKRGIWLAPELSVLSWRRLSGFFSPPFLFFCFCFLTWMWGIGLLCVVQRWFTFLWFINYQTRGRVKVVRATKRRRRRICTKEPSTSLHGTCELKGGWGGFVPETGVGGWGVSVCHFSSFSHRFLVFARHSDPFLWAKHVRKKLAYFVNMFYKENLTWW